MSSSCRARKPARSHHVTLAAALLATFVTVDLARADDTPPEFPAITAPASKASLPGKIIYAELVAPQLSVVEAFYGQLLGWTFKDIPTESMPGGKGLRYAEAMLNGENVATLVERPMPPGSPHHPFWLPVIASADTDATAAAVTANGGRTLFTPHDVPGMGRIAVFADPQGAVFGALHSASGDPADDEAMPGDWIWSALFTANPADASKFYQTLFNYQIDASPDAQPERPQWIASSGGYARASFNRSSQAAPTGSSGHWLRFIRVDGVGAAAEKAAKLGGRVLVEPHIDRDGSMVAVIADPAGAAFGIMEWNDSVPEESPK